MEEKVKTKFAVDLNQLTLKVYNMIAMWNNEDGSPEEKKQMLKVISQEIIETVLNDVLHPIEAQTKIQVMPGEEYLKKKKNVWDKLFNR